MAGGATFKLKRRMFIDKRTQRLNMALRADCVLIRIRLQQLVLEGPMRIVAVGANQQALIHLVVKGLGEGGFYVSVAAIAQLRLRDLEQMRFTLERVVAVTVDATNTNCAMSRTIEVRMCPNMAA